jgi:peptidoglycan/LPS O-acetylase OafA/YrhL
MSERRLPELDGVRGIAVATVMLHHFSSTTVPPKGILQNAAAMLLNFGWAGVDLFFVLSGLLITGILLRTRLASNYFRSFYARRCLRIFPIAYLSIGAWFWVVAPLFRHFHVPEYFNGIPSGVSYPSIDQFWFWLYLENWGIGHNPVAIGHFWSLAIEEQFYTIWPLVVFLYARRMKPICIAIMAVALIVRASLLLSGFSSDALYHYTFCRFDELAAGALLATVLFEGGATQGFRRASLMAISLLCAVVILESSSIFATPAMSVFGPSLLAVSFAGLLSLAMAPPPWLTAALSARPLRALGKYSYAMYVFHYPIILVVRQVVRAEFHGFWGQMLLTMAAGFLITYLVAVLSWNLIEKKMSAFKEHFRANVSEPRGTAAVAV